MRCLVCREDTWKVESEPTSAVTLNGVRFVLNLKCAMCQTVKALVRNIPISWSSDGIKLDYDEKKHNHDWKGKAID